MSDKPKPMGEFERLTSTGSYGNLITDLYYFFLNTKKWWLMPIIVVLLFLGALFVLSGTAVAPFIYTMF